MSRFLKKWKILAAILAILLLLVSCIYLYNYIRIYKALDQNPIIYSFSLAEKEVFLHEFNIQYIDEITIIEAQYFYDFREPSCRVIFEFPKNNLDEFVRCISTDYYEVDISLYRGTDSKKPDKMYYSNKIMYTSFSLYLADSSVRAVLIYYRPGEKILNIFKCRL